MKIAGPFGKSISKRLQAKQIPSHTSHGFDHRTDDKIHICMMKHGILATIVFAGIGLALPKPAPEPAGGKFSLVVLTAGS